ncbi:hypothetical protein [Paenibacillus glycanilyticus]|uniref:hypothetical protein n=1 Tax=Paenibacillus glycanilyticus TaxID=126569 RepID=UPI0019109202|nr:hypothetical protein [Paenibacillus glycanilyticus]
MKKGWFELDVYNYDGYYCGDCSKTWAIHIYSYEDDSAPDITLILHKAKEYGNSYYLMDYSITYIGRKVMFDEATAMVRKLDQLSSNNVSVSLIEHLTVCSEFFDDGKYIQKKSENLRVK